MEKFVDLFLKYEVFNSKHGRKNPSRRLYSLLRASGVYYLFHRNHAKNFLWINTTGKDDVFGAKSILIGINSQSYRVETIMPIPPNNTSKTYGVWGLGVSGTSIVRYLLAHGVHVIALEKNSVPNAAFFAQNNIRIFRDPDERQQFFDACDIIVPSPGIDLRPHPQILPKISAEIDLFQAAWHKPIIGITGTLGKTSITHLLSTLLTTANKRVATGGNIGIGMLDLVPVQDEHDCAVLELSSFQLDYAKKIAPHLAILTNIFENHLDRHGSLEAYIAAKTNIFACQGPTDIALAPLSLAGRIRADARFTTKHFAWFSMAAPTAAEKKYILDHDSCFVATDAGFERVEGSKKTLFLPKATIPPISFVQNWLVLAAACDMLAPELGIDAQALISRAAPVLAIPHNRLEFVATIDGVDYFNDSKSTIMQATIAAVRERAPQPVILLLGGLSKGVDRLPYLSELAPVLHVICFGGEADQLAAACARAEIPAIACAQLEPALEAARTLAQPGECVLFSPGGASFDLFRNYEERGTYFVHLVNRMGAASSQ